MMDIKPYGKLIDLIDTSKVEITLPITVIDLKAYLEAQFPELSSVHYTIAVDNELIFDRHFIISDAHSIALMPPFSGG